MKVGDLVKINRHMLGVPMGSHGEVWIHIVQLIGSSRVNTSLPILSRDLEVVA